MEKLSDIYWWVMFFKEGDNKEKTKHKRVKIRANMSTAKSRCAETVVYLRRYKQRELVATITLGRRSDVR